MLPAPTWRKTLFSAGMVIVVNFPGVEGMKRRPAIVLSSDIYHATRPDLILGLITSQTAAATHPSDYVLQDWVAVGLRRSSAFRAFIVTVPRASVTSEIGHLSDADWQAVSDRVRVALAVL